MTSNPPLSHLTRPPEDQLGPLPQTGLSFPQTGLRFPRTGLSFPQTGLSFPQTGLRFPRTGLSFPQTGLSFPPTGLRRVHAFSLVEVILSLTILSLLVSISVSYYQDSTEEVKVSAAINELKEIQDAVDRWSLENNRTYPYTDLSPLEGSYIQGIREDPWGSSYQVLPEQGIVFSAGPDGESNGGASGDDIVRTLGVIFQANPLPPRKLSAEDVGSGSVQLTWEPPEANVDGTPLATGVGTWYYEVARNDATGESSEAVVIGTVAFNTLTFDDNIGTAVGTSYYYVVRVKQDHPEKGTVLSGYSNQSGVYVSGEIPPEIVRFRPSSYSTAVGDDWYLDIDVRDPSGNLNQVTVDFNGTNNRPITNTAFFAEKFRPPPITSPSSHAAGTITLTVKGGSTGDLTTSSVIPLEVEFVNSAPSVNSFRPGVTNFTVSDLTTDVISFIVEARDKDANLKKIHVWDVGNAGTSMDLLFPPSGDYPPDTDFAVERFSWEYDLSTTQAINVFATAEDALNQVSPTRLAVVAVSADVTPPATPLIDLAASNSVIATDCNIYQWWLTSQTAIKGHWESFDAETEPVTYQALITTAPFSDPPTAAELDDAISMQSGTPGWTSEVTTNNFVLEYIDGSNGGLIAPLDETFEYWVGVRATNNANLVNPTVSLPINPSCNLIQYPFGVDVTPPVITSINIETPFPGVPWISQGPLVMRWSATDNDAGGNPGSGPYIYRYRVNQYLTTMALPYHVITNQGDLLSEGETKGQEIRLPIYLSVSPHHRATLTVNLDVRDQAGNWSTDTVTSVVRVDMTAPGFFTDRPKIIALDDTIRDPNSVEVTWAGTGTLSSVFIEPESGIESFSWGIATSSSLSVPDIYPGGGLYEQAVAPQLSSLASRPGLFQDGDVVYLYVKARNYAGTESSNSVSKPTFVDTDLEATLNATPSFGYAPFSVQFEGSVKGGGPCYKFNLQPRSSPTGPDNFLYGPSGTAVAEDSFPPRNINYTSADVGARTARMIVESLSATSLTPSITCDVVTQQSQQTEATIEIRQLPYLTLLTTSGTDTYIQVYDGLNSSFTFLGEVQVLPPAPQTPPAAAEVPIEMLLDPSDSTRFATVLANNPTDEYAAIYRVELGAGLKVTHRVLIPGIQIIDGDLSGDGSVLIGTANTTNTVSPPLVHFRSRLSGGVPGTPEIFTPATTIGVGPGRAAISRTGQDAFISFQTPRLDHIKKANESAPVFTYAQQSATPPNEFVPALEIDLTPNGNTLIMGPKDGLGGPKVGFMDTETLDVSSVLLENPDIVGSTENVIQVFSSRDGQYAYFLEPQHFIRIETSSGSFGRIQSVNAFGSPSPFVVTRGDLSFEGSFMVVTSGGSDFHVIHTAPAGVNPFLPGPGRSPGQSIVDGVTQTGRDVVDVKITNRPRFGSPIVFEVEPTTATAIGQPIKVRGWNFNPGENLKVMVGSIEITNPVPCPGELYNCLQFSMPPAVENTSPGYAIKVRNEDFPGEIKESTDAVFLLLDLP